MGDSAIVSGSDDVAIEVEETAMAPEGKLSDFGVVTRRSTAKMSMYSPEVVSTKRPSTVF